MPPTNTNSMHPPPIHGLSYPPSFLSSLPVLTPRPSPHQPIRLLPLPAFNHIHFKALTSHAPDNVLFPFLHGLEGSNHAQNMFFATAGAGGAAAGPGGGGPGGSAAVVPKFRGLIWVVCEEDLEVGVPAESTSGSGYSDIEDLEDDFYSSEDEEDDERYSEMDVCTTSSTSPVPDPVPTSTSTSTAAGVGETDFAMDVDDGDADRGQQTHRDTNGHMHPVVHHRPSNHHHHHKKPVPVPVPGVPVPSPTQIQIQIQPHDRRPSNASLASTTTTTSTSESCASLDLDLDLDTEDDTEDDRYSVSTSATSFLPSPSIPGSLCPSPTTATAPPPPPPPASASSPPTTTTNASTKQPPSQKATPTSTVTPALAHTTRPRLRPPPILTSTFKSKDLIRFNMDGEPEFIPPKVPEGISLRNFGIQVPIYATLSDIVIYSPKGLTRASMALAERFKVAVEKKAGERRERLGVGCGFGNNGGGGKGKGLGLGRSPLSSHSVVGVTDETETETGKGDEESGDGGGEGGEGEGEDLISYNVFILDATASEMEETLPHLIVRMQGAHKGQGQGGGGAHTEGTDGETSGEGNNKEKKQMGGWKSNTIDFALREKEEMRDLTKASEIISVLPASSTSTSASPSTSTATHTTAAAKTKTKTAGDVKGVNGEEEAIVGGGAGAGGGEEEEVTLDLDLSGSTTASYWDPTIGQVFLGNSNDVPLVPSPPPSPRLRARNNSSDMDIYSEDAHHHHATTSSTSPSSSSRTSHPTTTTKTTTTTTTTSPDDPFTYKPTNDPSKGFGYDICVECHEMAPFPSTAHLRAADEHLQMLDALWADRNGQGFGYPESVDGSTGAGEGTGKMLPVRPPPNANAIVHLPFPSSPPSTAGAVASLLPFVKFLERVLQPVEPAPPPPPSNNSSSSSSGTNPHPRRWSSVSSMIPSFPAPSSYQSFRSRSSTSPSSSYTPRVPKRTRPLKVLIYSSDGYTESSVPALCLLMAVRGLSLPEAYLELQVVKKRSFFVYQNDLGVLRRVEGRLMSEREQERARGVVGRPGFGATGGSKVGSGSGGSGGSLGRQNGWARFSNPSSQYGSGGGDTSSGGGYTRPSYYSGGRPAANSISVTMPTTPAQNQQHIHPSSSFGGAYPHSTSASVDMTLSPPMMIVPSQNHMVKSRPRASTSPWLPSLFEDHQSWFSDPRFDGSFPSRVLPFLYLGNLNHASNAYMLHALGITHVVSVGECALVPPPHDGDASTGGVSCHRPSGSGAQFIAGKGPGGQGSLWIEEREGRIKVLDIKGVCDDGIDTLEPQLQPICDWIEKARREGGQVLVHCRVGVSRSATVTIAYVMKHLSLPLVDAYLIVRSRRLSVLIQPNMRLLYNLCGWEVKLARERAGDDEEQLRSELARTLSWPYLAREVHSLNEKYLH